MRIRAVDIETTGLTPPEHTICEARRKQSAKGGA
jgi:hypothetical protein